MKRKQKALEKILSVLPLEVFAIVEVFRQEGFQCFPVGGALRDILLERPVVDFDLTTDATPSQVMKLFPKVIPTGIDHGTVTLIGKEHKYEITTFRTEENYSDHRHPDSVSFSSSIEEDLSRRDFTINALAVDLLNKELIDLFNGLEDIEDRIIRTIGDPDKRFTEDALRMMRFCRFASVLKFKTDNSSFEAVKRNAHLIDKISKERVRDELVKILLSVQPSTGLELLRRAGLMERIIPELLEGFGIEQNRFHRYDIYEHNIKTCDAASRLTEDLSVRMAALLHDIGKSRTINKAEGKENTFYNHEITGAILAKEILKRLKFSNQFIDKVFLLIKNHMFHYTRDWSDAAVRRFMRKTEMIMDELFILREADRIGSGKKSGDSKILAELKEKIEQERKKESAFKLKDLALDGNDVMRILNIPPSPKVGEILNSLLESVLEDPSLNTKEKLEELIKKM